MIHSPSGRSCTKWKKQTKIQTVIILFIDAVTQGSDVNNTENAFTDAQNGPKRDAVSFKLDTGASANDNPKCIKVSQFLSKSMGWDYIYEGWSDLCFVCNIPLNPVSWTKFSWDLWRGIGLIWGEVLFKPKQCSTVGSWGRQNHIWKFEEYK